MTTNWQQTLGHSKQPLNTIENMKIAKQNIPTKINVPGAIARQQLDFGDATGYAKMAGEYFSLGAGTDIAPLLKGWKTISANLLTGAISLRVKSP